MRFCLLILLCLTTSLGPANSTSPEKIQGSQVHLSPTAEALVGAWHLVSVKTVRPNGEVIYPFYGKNPEGLLIYDRSGWMSVQIVSDPKPNVPTGSSREGFLAAPLEEKVKAVDGYYAYLGTWTVQESDSTVTHHIKQSLYPGERGSDGVRHLTISGNHLTLVAKTHEMGEDHERRLFWERIPELGR